VEGWQAKPDGVVGAGQDEANRPSAILGGAEWVLSKDYNSHPCLIFAIMPFTPLHLGPGAIFKALGGRHFSFLVFGGSQALMDIEPLLGILQDKDILHGGTHTLLGASIIGALAGFAGKPLGIIALKWLSVPHYPLTWAASFAGAYLGVFSHIVLDAVMHSDMSPWWPVASGNSLLGLMSTDHLHLSCLLTGVVGAIIIAVRFKLRGRA
jgi:membrane-bound metal-dependent hydrolase YbcI (DUF457 family)